MTTIRRLDGDQFVDCVTDELLDVLTFAGGEPHVNVHRPDDIAGGTFLLDARIDSFDVLGELLVVNDALRRSGAATVIAAIPYLPGARQDRSENGGPLTAKVYAGIINAARFDAVICVDPHSPVMPALLERLLVIGADEAIDATFVEGGGRRVVLVCPDAGAAKRTEAIAERFDLDVVYARKHRNPRTGALDRFSCGPIPDGALAVVVDDICDGGGTFIGLADALGRPREQMRLWTTHGIYSKGLAALLERFERIGCTDSFPPKATPDATDATAQVVRPIADALTTAATRFAARRTIDPRNRA